MFPILMVGGGETYLKRKKGLLDPLLGFSTWLDFGSIKASYLPFNPEAQIRSELDLLLGFHPST